MLSKSNDGSRICGLYFKNCVNNYVVIQMKGIEHSNVPCGAVYLYAVE